LLIMELWFCISGKWSRFKRRWRKQKRKLTIYIKE
jgi:hypothetical protein